MTVSGESAPVAAEPRRAGRELVLEGVFRPLAGVFVPLLRRWRIPPPAVVLANAIVGLAAAGLLAGGELVAAALTVQLKTLLDNLDGQLARATGRVTLAGRYLDTLADVVVNASLFFALAVVSGRPLLAFAAFGALTVVLAVDFNATQLHREASGVVVTEPVVSGSRSERRLAAAYDVLLGPLDRIIRARARRAFPPGTSYDSLTLTALANLGLSTQLLVLGAFLMLDAPAGYLWFVLGCLALVIALQLRAERQGRAA